MVSIAALLLSQQVAHACRVKLSLQIGHIPSLFGICVSFGVEDLIRGRLVLV